MLFYFLREFSVFERIFLKWEHNDKCKIFHHKTKNNSQDVRHAILVLIGCHVAVTPMASCLNHSLLVSTQDVCQKLLICCYVSLRQLCTHFNYNSVSVCPIFISNVTLILLVCSLFLGQ